jgi:hypothetical protein
MLCYLETSHPEPAAADFGRRHRARPSRGALRPVTVGSGFLERTHVADACASLWVDGELGHLEDLVLHDTGQDIRTPTHELTIAHDVLRSCRQIASQRAGSALGPDGIRGLRGQAWPGASVGADGAIASKDHLPDVKAEDGEGRPLI